MSPNQDSTFRFLSNDRTLFSIGGIQNSPTEASFDPFALLNSFQEALYVVDRNYTVIYANEKAKVLLNITTGHTDRQLLNLVSPSKKEKIASYIKRAFSGKSSSYETLADDISVATWFQVMYTPVKDAVGEIQHVSVNIKDISQRKRIELFKEEFDNYEKRLFQSRVLFEQFMENAPFVAWVTDHKGNMRYMNPLYRKIYGFNLADTGKSLYEIFSSQMAVDYHLNNLRVIKEGKAIETLEKAQTADGTEQVLRIFKFPISSDGESMVGGWAVDMTEQLKMQEDLTSSVERYYYVNEATSDAIYDWDIASGKMYHGDDFYTLFGFPEKSVSLRYRLTRIHPDDLSLFKTSVFNALRDPIANKWKVEYRMADAHGKYRTVVDKAFIIRDHQKSVRVIGALQDITEHKELQSKLIQQEKKNKREIVRSIIETQEKERRQLSVELHDNINQMLASCKLMLEVACDNREAAAALTRKAHQNLEIAITEIRKLSHQLNPSTLEDIGLDDAIKELVDTINLAGTLKVRYSCTGYDENAEIKTRDKVAIYRIVQEQLTNILKHAKATVIDVTLRFELPKVYICLQDDGIGFDLAKMKKGLGLKSIQNRIDYYNGTLEIETTPKKGCILNAYIHIDY